jgi:hypothetical protein
MSKITPIRPGVKVSTPTKKKRRDPQELQLELFDFSQRAGQVASLAKSLAIALDGETCAFGMEPTEGCLGIAELCDSLNNDLYVLSESFNKTRP